MKYKSLCAVYSDLESTSKRLSKTFVISELLKKTSDVDIKMVTLLLQGKIFPPWSSSKIGVADKLILKSINVSTGIDLGIIEDKWRSLGDLGLVAEELISKKKQVTLFSKDLLVSKVFLNLRNLAEASGSGAVDKKVQLISELLTSASPLEAKYIVRTVLEDLRVGVGSGSLRDSIVWAFFSDKFKLNFDRKDNNFDISDDERVIYNEYVNAVQHAYDLSNDFSEVALLAKLKGLDGLNDVKLNIGVPLKVMLFQKADDLADAFKIVNVPCAIDFKYDGFRMQIHKKKDKISCFTRRLEDVTAQFPDVVDIVKDNVKSDNFIIDVEIVGFDMKNKKYLAFQNISQRIKRKYDIHMMAKEVPIMVCVFDAMLIDNINILDEPFVKRRDLLNKVVKQVPFKIQLAEEILTDDLKLAEKFYKDSLAKGNEGVMVKNLDGVYKPGSRVGFGVKVKPVMETLDCVIVGADWGEGKRSSWLSSFTLAVFSDGKFLQIGKVGTGIKEKDEEGVSFDQLTKLLKPLITSEKGRHVEIKPKIVIEINYEEIQASKNYSSGFALRFPRFVKIRDDKSAEEASELSFVKQLYDSQRDRK